MLGITRALPEGGRTAGDADVVRRASIRRVGPCEMVEIDIGARIAGERPTLGASLQLQLQLAAPAWPPTWAAFKSLRWLSRAQQKRTPKRLILA